MDRACEWPVQPMGGLGDREGGSGSRSLPSSLLQSLWDRWAEVGVPSMSYGIIVLGKWGEGLRFQPEGS